MLKNGEIQAVISNFTEGNQCATESEVGSMKIPVGKLKVSGYIDVRCNKHTWDLIYMPVINCPYYLTLDKGERAIHDEYVSVIKKRHPNWEDSPSNRYESLIELYCDIKKNGYIPEKADAPMKVWICTTVLEDGHHRAAVLCKLYGPQYMINVEDGSPVQDNGLPPDHYLCSNPCKE
jgi:hypothetical protein